MTLRSPCLVRTCYFANSAQAGGERRYGERPGPPADGLPGDDPEDYNTTCKPTRHSRNKAYLAGPLGLVAEDDDAVTVQQGPAFHMGSNHVSISLSATNAI
jgi:hypothetical protein